MSITSPWLASIYSAWIIAGIDGRNRHAARMFDNLYLDCSGIAAMGRLVGDHFDLVSGCWFSADVATDAFDLNRLTPVDASAPMKFIQRHSNPFQFIQGAALNSRNCPCVDRGQNCAGPLI